MARKTSNKKNTEKEFSQYDYNNAFYTDMQFDGMYYAVIIYSAFSSGNIKSIIFPDDMPNDVKFFSAQNIPGVNKVEALNFSVKLFTDKEIDYIYQPIGILTGSELKQLEKIKKNIQIEYDGDGDGEINSTVYNDDLNTFSGNDILEKKIVSSGNSEDIFIESNYKIEKKISTKLVSKFVGEPQGAIVNFDGENLTVYTPTRWSSNLRKNLSSVLNLDEEKINIKKTLCYDFGTNSLWFNSVIASQVAVASYNLKKTVKLVISSEEQKIFLEEPIPVSLNYRISTDSINQINSMNILIVLNAGIGNPFLSEILDRLIIASCGLYDSENIHIEAYAIKSRRPSYSANLHWIDAQSLYGIETVVQAIATELNIDPDVFRLNNMLTLQKKNKAKNFLIYSNTMSEILQIVQKESDFKRKFASYSMNRNFQKNLNPMLPLRGIGLATAFEGSGLFGSVINPSKFFMEVEMDIDNTVTIFAYTPSRTVESIWKNIVSELLNVPVENVTLNSNFTYANEPELPETLNDNISIMTQLLKKCCNGIQTQRFRHPLPIKIKRTFSGGKKEKWNSETMSGLPYYSTSLGAVVAEIEIDPATFIEKIRGIWIVIDGGELLDVKAAMLAVKKSVQKVLASIHEDFKLSSDIIKVKFINSSEQAKQIGEIVYNTLPAAIGSAISNAFMHTIHSMPLTTDMIYELVYDKNNEEQK